MELEKSIAEERYSMVVRISRVAKETLRRFENMDDEEK
jgi:hypothetical protein